MYHNAKILVVGDVMLDRYWFSEVDRISPEAPVPVAKVNRIENRPGGAANVARSIAALGGDTTLLSVIGCDEAAVELESLLKQENVDCILKPDATTTTIVKLRIMAKNQQLIRADFETPPSHEILEEVLDIYKEILANYDAVVLSDYGKGGLNHITQMINLACEQKKIVLIDPKGNDYERYTHATILTPNKKELQEAVGAWSSEEELQQKAFILQNKLKLKYLLLTRSEEGMTLFYDNQVYNYPTYAREVFDVSGAGDTVISTLALMLANNIAINEAVRLANIAASIVVGKLGTATVSYNELFDELNNMDIEK